MYASILLIWLGFWLICAAQYISGWAEDTLSGKGVNDKGVALWNPSVGTGDNVTDLLALMETLEQVVIIWLIFSWLWLFVVLVMTLLEIWIWNALLFLILWNLLILVLVEL